MKLGPPAARSPAEDDLEQRRLAGSPDGLQLLHELLEREVLVRVALEGDLSDAPEKLTEARIAGKIAPEHERVDEEADQALGLHLGPPGDRRADGDVFLPGVPREEELNAASTS